MFLSGVKIPGVEIMRTYREMEAQKRMRKNLGESFVAGLGSTMVMSVLFLTASGSLMIFGTTS